MEANPTGQVVDQTLDSSCIESEKNIICSLHEVLSEESELDN